MDKRPLPKLDPAASIIARLGGPEAVAAGLNRPLSIVHRWTYPRERGGTGGLIPQKNIPAVRTLAENTGVTLTADDFMQMPEQAA